MGYRDKVVVWSFVGVAFLFSMIIALYEEYRMKRSQREKECQEKDTPDDIR